MLVARKVKKKFFLYFKMIFWQKQFLVGIVNIYNNEVVIMQRLRKMSRMCWLEKRSLFHRKRIWKEWEKAYHIQEMVIGTREEFWETKLER